MFEFLITRPMGWIIQQIYNLVANYGLSIIIFTVLIKLILLPLNIHSQKAMKKQQKVQPIIAQLQEKYKNDQEKLQREMMKIYKENNISMTGGCLPMFIQFPILIGLYQVIQKPLSYLKGVDWMQQAVIDKVYMLRDAMASSIGSLAQQTEEQLANMSQIQLSNWAGIVNGPSDPWVINFNFLGLDLSNVPSEAFGYIMRLDFSDWSKILLLLIPILAVVSALLTNKITMLQTGQNKTNDNSQASQMQKSMLWMMPLMSGFFTLTLPSGLGIYWIISSVMQIIQQLVLNYYFDKKGEEIVVKIPEQKQLHGKKSKKRK
ncbi:MAG: YidC/Oxa1 family membrane protein insertase [Monoglobales bacterium]